MAGTLTRSLIVEKEKSAVLAVVHLRDDHRPTCTKAELVQFEGRNRVIGRIEVVFRIEGAVAEELVSSPMQLICAGLDGHVQYRATGAAEFRAHGIGLHLELGDGVRRRSH